MDAEVGVGLAFVFWLGVGDVEGVVRWVLLVLEYDQKHSQMK